jgi:hypothetical protein
MCRSTNEDREWIGWKRSDDPEPSVLSSSIRHDPPRPKYALKVIRDAQDAFVAPGARAEYCRTKGIDYERSVKYLPIIEHLERAYSTNEEEEQTALTLYSKPELPLTSQHSNDPKESEMVVSVQKGHPYLEMRTFPDGAGPEIEGQYMVRVRIMGMSDETFYRIVKEGRCPLCGKMAHSLAMCPIMPKEMRPFC